MNRQQAEHILDAYISMCYAVDADDSSDAKKAKCALREVILDAMADFRTGIYPTITLPSTKPSVTYTTADKMPTVAATCSGIDPLFKQQTTGVGE